MYNLYTVSLRSKAIWLMLEGGIFFSVKIVYWISHCHPCLQAMACKWYSYAVFHTEATPAFHLENISWLEAMAYKPILQAALEYEPCGFLLGTYCSAFTRRRKHQFTTITITVNMEIITVTSMDIKLQYGLSNQYVSVITIVMASVLFKLSNKLTQSSSVSFDCYHITITNTLSPDWLPLRNLKMSVPWSKHDRMTAAETTPAAAQKWRVA